MFEKINAIELKQLEYQKDTDEKFGRIFDVFSFLTDIIPGLLTSLKYIYKITY